MNAAEMQLGIQEPGKAPMSLQELLVNCLCVGAGGCVGAICRYLVGLAVPAHGSGLPVGTLVVNVVGSFVIALVTVWFLRHAELDGRVLLFLTTGVCGGFTTFSTFTWESLQLIQRGDVLVAGAYIVASVVVCLVAAFAGAQAALRLPA